MVLISPQVSVNDKGKSLVEYDINVSIDIPPKTTLAYSVIELDVAHTGHYGIAVLLKQSILHVYTIFRFNLETKIVLVEMPDLHLSKKWHSIRFSLHSI